MTLDFGHSDALPTLAGPPQSGKDQFQTALLREEPRDGTGPATLFQETALQQIGRADALVMDCRATKIGNAGFPIILERAHRRWIATLVGFQRIRSDHVCDLAVGCIVGSSDCVLDLCTRAVRDFVRYVAGLVGQAPLPQAVGKGFLNGTDEARCSVGGDQDGRLQTTSGQISKELKPVRVRFLVTKSQVQHHLAHIGTDGPRTQNAFLASALLVRFLAAGQCSDW